MRIGSLIKTLAILEQYAVAVTVLIASHLLALWTDEGVAAQNHGFRLLSQASMVMGYTLFAVTTFNILMVVWSTQIVYKRSLRIHVMHGASSWVVLKHLLLWPNVLYFAAVVAGYIIVNGMALFLEGLSFLPAGVYQPSQLASGSLPILFLAGAFVLNLALLLISLDLHNRALISQQAFSGSRLKQLFAPFLFVQTTGSTTLVLLALGLLQKNVVPEMTTTEASEFWKDYFQAIVVAACIAIGLSSYLFTETVLLLRKEDWKLHKILGARATDFGQEILLSTLPWLVSGLMVGLFLSHLIQTEILGLALPRWRYLLESAPSLVGLMVLLLSMSWLGVQLLFRRLSVHLSECN